MTAEICRLPKRHNGKKYNVWHTVCIYKGVSVLKRGLKPTEGRLSKVIYKPN